MGFNSFMVRTAKAFDRLLVILSLAHFFFICGLELILPFHVGLRSARTAFSILLICSFIVEVLKKVNIAIFLNFFNEEFVVF